jgi:hypothetical protein
MAALSMEGGKVAVTLPYQGAVPDKVQVIPIGVEHAFDEDKLPELKRLRGMFQVLLDEGMLKPNPIQVSIKYMRIFVMTEAQLVQL